MTLIFLRFRFFWEGISSFFDNSWLALATRERIEGSVSKGVCKDVGLEEEEGSSTGLGGEVMVVDKLFRPKNGH